MLCLCHSAVTTIDICCRSADIPVEHKGRREFSDVVILMPGPREPKNVDPYLEPLLLELVKYGPKGEHLQVELWLLQPY